MWNDQLMIYKQTKGPACSDVKQEDPTTWRGRQDKGSDDQAQERG